MSSNIARGLYFFTRPSSAGIIRVQVSFQYMRKYGISSLDFFNTVEKHWHPLFIATTSGSVNLCIIHWTGPSKKECDELLPKNAILKFMFSKKATKIDEIFTVYWHLLHNVKSSVKISSNFVAFLENVNFNIVFLRKYTIII